MYGFHQTELNGVDPAPTTLLAKIRKRDGRVVPFEASKITQSLAKLGQVTGEYSESMARRLALQIVALAQPLWKNAIPEVDEIRQIIEEILRSANFQKSARMVTQLESIGRI